MGLEGSQMVFGTMVLFLFLCCFAFLLVVALLSCCVVAMSVVAIRSRKVR